uniref:Uncharacterized protein n=1 Tax=Timema cristinae TaxID=61476 RepID=A0A7R9GW74_TIMCR|nr:unnamed protein product [Timema cristinae]
MLVRQLEEELRMRMRNPSIEMQQQMEALFAENEHLTREISILRETIKSNWQRVGQMRPALTENVAINVSWKKIKGDVYRQLRVKKLDNPLGPESSALDHETIEQFRSGVPSRSHPTTPLGIRTKASLPLILVWGGRGLNVNRVSNFPFTQMQELELRIETQKQTLQARDESIKKLLEMLQNKGMGNLALLSVAACLSIVCVSDSLYVLIKHLIIYTPIFIGRAPYLMDGIVAESTFIFSREGKEFKIPLSYAAVPDLYISSFASGSKQSSDSLLLSSDEVRTFRKCFEKRAPQSVVQQYRFEFYIAVIN